MHIERLPTWKNAKHGQQWINTLRDCAFPKIGRMPIDSVGQPEVLMPCADLDRQARDRAAAVSADKAALDVPRPKGYREGEKPVVGIRDGNVLQMELAHHKAMRWQDVPAFYSDLQTRNAMAAKALMFTCLTGSRTGEILGVGKRSTLPPTYGPAPQPERKQATITAFH